ncbi:hypothetical protein A6R68_11085, partial [Neotoma lepida]
KVTASSENFHVGENDENMDRGNWSKKSDYLLSMVGYAVGLGNVWRFPYLTYTNGGGVGITMVLISIFVTIYYNVIIAYSLYYLFASFQSVLPWANCSSWADNNCSRTPIAKTIDSVLIKGLMYFSKVTLQRSSGMDETGVIVWYLALCLLLAWLIVGAALFKGIKSSGKVVYFTALFPYVVLLILLIRGATLEGASKGISYYIGAQSNFTKLKEAEVWKDAATQIFYSLSVAWGGLVALSSYNKFNNNCYSDAIVVCLTNCLTKTITTTIQDLFPKAMKRMRVPITLGCCLILFLLGLVCVTQAGIYWVHLIDHFCAGWGILIAAILEIAGIIWIYGGNRFIEDIEMMIGAKRWIFWLWWRACWFIITPILLSAILVWSLVKFHRPDYGDIPYPDWGVALGWCMIIFCIIWIPIMAIIKIVQAEGNILQRIISCCRPASNWGPYLEKHRGERYKDMAEPAKETDHEIPTISGSRKPE